MAAVELLAIKFNHDPDSANVDALNIRKNAAEFVTVPEWRRGVTVNPEDSPAAYSIGDSQGTTITIQASFRQTAQIKKAQIRAVDPTVNPPGPRGCMGWLVKLILALVRALTGNVLGQVKARKVTFGLAGFSGYVTFDLKGTTLHKVGVGARTTKWRWQYRLKRRGPWIDFDETQHRIYSVLKTPTAPWSQTPYSVTNVSLPWTEALDRSCNWAVLSADIDAAADRVTRAIYNLGPSVVEYDCPNGGSSHYATFSGSFDLTAFLDRLSGGIGSGKYVNCTDCATFVSTFSNLLGADLWQSRMGWSFGLNPLLAIGSAVWQPACGWPGFSYHEVAWKGACGNDDRMFDACLQVDGDADPTAAPHTPLLPTNMVFGATGSGHYRDRLATPAGRPNCNPQPSTRVRRQVF